MPLPILTTKLYIPVPRAQTVPRAHLVQRLQHGLHGKLTLISAAAGFGKTTLVSEWLNTCPRPAAWLSLDGRENELSHFLTYLIAALQTVQPTLSERALTMLHAPQPAPTAVVLTTLLNEITAMSQAFILVLDDYHLLDSQAVDEALIFLLEHLPPQMHLVIVTRENPPLPLARYRVQGQLTELRAADLRFTAEEAAAFFNQVMALTLSPAEIEALESRTEGWIAGLQLAALALQAMSAPKDIHRFIQSFSGSHHFVLDYLMEEVLQQQPENIQTFLLSTAVLNRLCSPLCQALLPDTAVSAPETLAYLEQANLFIIPLDDERRWYRYHHLFADLLRQRLQQRGDEWLAACHGRASQWFEDNGFEADAIHHALAAKDFERSARLIELAWPEMNAAFQSSAWLAWANQLPAAMVQRRPNLIQGIAWALLDAGEMEAAMVRVQEAERWLEFKENETPAAHMIIEDEKQFQLFPAELSSARSYHAQIMGDIPSTIHYTQQTIARLPEDAEIKRALAAGMLGIIYWTIGDLASASQTLRDVFVRLQHAGHILYAVSITYALGRVLVEQGELRAAVTVHEQALQLAQAQAPMLLGTADQYLWLCELLLAQGEVAKAKRYLEKSETLGAQLALPDWTYRLALTRARVQEVDGDLDGVLDQLEKAEAAYYPIPVPDVCPIPAQKARVWIKQGKLAKARSWVQTRGLSVTDELTYLYEFEHITLARLLLAEFDHGRDPLTIQQAATLLNRLLPAAQAGGRKGHVIEILILQSLIHQARDNAAFALQTLEQALTLAAPESCVQLFVAEGTPMKVLLARYQADKKEPNQFIYKLLTQFGTNEDPQRSAPVVQPLVDPLSEREIEVLQLIADGHSNREISERLFLALSTIKGHNRRIFDKLQVQRRTEAVARARELGLL